MRKPQGNILYNPTEKELLGFLNREKYSLKTLGVKINQYTKILRGIKNIRTNEQYWASGFNYQHEDIIDIVLQTDQMDFTLLSMKGSGLINNE
jgi:hypothetical protein